MHTVSGGTCVDAWKQAVNLIVQDRVDIKNLIVSINDPTHLEPQWLTRYDPRKCGRQYDHIRDVINTVFPIRLAGRHAQRDALYAAYDRVHGRASTRRWNRSRWGTYFQRLTNFDGSGVNQLERAIRLIGSWQRKEAVFVFHLSAPNVDGVLPRGGPCWHYGEIVWNPDDSLDFVVVYRNHDYFNKALGNFLALGQLLAFICTETGKVPGRMVCHSVHVYRSTSNVLLRQFAT